MHECPQHHLSPVLLSVIVWMAILQGVLFRLLVFREDTQDRSLHYRPQSYSTQRTHDWREMLTVLLEIMTFLSYKGVEGDI